MLHVLHKSCQIQANLGNKLWKGGDKEAITINVVGREGGQERVREHYTGDRKSPEEMLTNCLLISFPDPTL